MPTFVGPSVRPSLEKMSKIVKIQELALEQKTKVNEHVEQAGLSWAKLSQLLAWSSYC